jgi:peptide/nickel transport system permease protein
MGWDTTAGRLPPACSSRPASRRPPPGRGWLIIVIIALIINFVGDGLRDALDPTQTRVRA